MNESAKMIGSIEIMARETASILNNEVHSFWIFGSTVLNDFHLGWSDIDFIAFAKNEITPEQAQELLTLRQKLSREYPEDPYFKCFEGAILSIEEYRKRKYKRLVYWGTTGQRISDSYSLDAFSRYELAKYGVSVMGDDDRSLFDAPTNAELYEAVKNHCRAIRQCAVQTDERLYSCGWLLDISRCIYTLRYNAVIGKTAAGEWALEKRLFHDDEPLKKALLIRRSPLEYKDKDDVKKWLCGLGPAVQSYADVLEAELALYSIMFNKN